MSHEPTHEEREAAVLAYCDGTMEAALTAANALRDKVWQEREQWMRNGAHLVQQERDAAHSRAEKCLARAYAAEADVAFLRRRRGELVIQRDEARQKGRANWCAWREALADAETWKARATAAEAALDACRRENMVEWHRLGRNTGLREAAAAANALGCLTTYQHGADIARAILALIDAKPTGQDQP
jgi:hypothetical protein